MTNNSKLKLLQWLTLICVLTSILIVFNHMSWMSSRPISDLRAFNPAALIPEWANAFYYDVGNHMFFKDAPPLSNYRKVGEIFGLLIVVGYFLPRYFSYLSNKYDPDKPTYIIHWKLEALRLTFVIGVVSSFLVALHNFAWLSSSPISDLAAFNPNIITPEWANAFFHDRGNYIFLKDSPLLNPHKKWSILGFCFFNIILSLYVSYSSKKYAPISIESDAK